MLILFGIFFFLLTLIVSRGKRRASKRDGEQDSNEAEVSQLSEQNSALQKQTDELASALAQRDAQLQAKETRLLTLDGILDESDSKVKNLQDQLQQKEIQRAQLQQQWRRSQHAATSVRATRDQADKVDTYPISLAGFRAAAGSRKDKDHGDAARAPQESSSKTMQEHAVTHLHGSHVTHTHMDVDFFSRFPGCGSCASFELHVSELQQQLATQVAEVHDLQRDMICLPCPPDVSGKASVAVCVMESSSDQEGLVSVLEKEVAELKMKNADLEGSALQLEQVKGEVAKLMESNEVLSGHNMTSQYLQDEMALLRVRNRDLEGVQKTLDVQIQFLVAQLAAKVSEEMRRMEADVQVLCAQSKEMEVALVEVERMKEVLCAAAGAAACVGAGQDDNMHLAAASKDLSVSLASLVGQCEGQKGELVHAHSELDRLRILSKGLSAEVEYLQRFNKELFTNVESLKALNRDTSSASESLKVQYEAQNAELGLARTEVERQQSCNKGLSSALEVIRGQYALQLIELDKLQSDRDQLLSLTEEQAGELQGLRKMLALAADEAIAQQNTVDLMQAELEYLGCESDCVLRELDCQSREVVHLGGTMKKVQRSAQGELCSMTAQLVQLEGLVDALVSQVERRTQENCILQGQLSEVRSELAVTKGFVRHKATALDQEVEASGLKDLKIESLTVFNTQIQSQLESSHRVCAEALQERDAAAAKLSVAESADVRVALELAVTELQSSLEQFRSCSVVDSSMVVSQMEVQLAHMEQLKHSNVTLQGRVGSLYRDVCSLSSQLALKQCEVELLSSQLADVSAQAATRDASSNAELERIKYRLSEATAEAAQAQMDASKVEVDKLSCQLRNAVAQGAELMAQVEMSNVKLDVMSGQLSDSSAEVVLLKVLQYQLDASKAEVDRLSRQLSDSTAEVVLLKDIQCQLDASIAAREDLSLQLSSLHEATDVANAGLWSLTVELAVAEELHHVVEKAQREELGAVREELVAVRGTELVLVEELGALRGAEQAVRVELDTVREDLSAAAVAVELLQVLQSQLEASKAEVDRLSAQLGSLTEAVDAANAGSWSLTVELAVAEELHHVVEKAQREELGAVREKLGAAAVSVETLQELDASMAEREQLSKQLSYAAAVAEVAELEASKAEVDKLSAQLVSLTEAVNAANAGSWSLTVELAVAEVLHHVVEKTQREELDAAREELGVAAVAVETLQELKSQLEVSKAEADRLSTQLSSVAAVAEVAELVASKAEVDRLSVNCAEVILLTNLQCQQDASRAEVYRLSVQLSDDASVGEVAELQRQLGARKAEIEQLSAQLSSEAAVAEVAELQSQLEASKAEVDRLSCLLDEATVDVALLKDLQSQLDASKAEVDRLSVQLGAAAAVAEVAELEASKTEVERLSATLGPAAAVGEVAELQSQLEASRAEVDRLSVLLGSLNEAVDAANAGSWSLTVELAVAEKLHHVVEKVQREELGAVREELGVAAADIENLQELKSQLDASKAEVDRLSCQLDKATVDAALLKDLQSRLDSSKAEVDRLSVQLGAAAAVAEVAELQSQLDASKAETEQLSCQLGKAAAVAEMVAELQRQLDASMAERELLPLQLSSLHEAVDAANAGAWSLTVELAVAEELHHVVEKAQREELCALRGAEHAVKLELDAVMEELRFLRQFEKAQREELGALGGVELAVREELGAAASALQFQLDDSKAAVDRLSRQLEDALAQGAELESQVEMSNAELDYVSGQLSDSTAEVVLLKDLQRQLDASKAEVDRLSCQLGKDTAEWHNLVSELDASKAEVEGMSVRLNNAGAELALLRDLAFDLDASETQVKSLACQLKDLQALLDGSQAETEKLSCQKLSDATVVVEMQALLDASNAEVDRLSCQLSEAAAEALSVVDLTALLDAYRTEVDRLSVQLSCATAEVETLRMEQHAHSAASKAEAERLCAQLNDAAAEVETLREELAGREGASVEEALAAQEELAAVLAENSTLQAKLGTNSTDSMAAKLALVEEQAVEREQALTAELGAVRSKLHELELELVAMQEEAVELKVEQGEVRKHVGVLVGECEAAEEEVAAAAIQIDNKSCELQALKCEVEDLTQSLAQATATADAATAALGHSQAQINILKEQVSATMHHGTAMAGVPDASPPHTPLDSCHVVEERESYYTHDGTLPQWTAVDSIINSGPSRLEDASCSMGVKAQAVRESLREHYAATLDELHMLKERVTETSRGGTPMSSAAVGCVLTGEGAQSQYSTIALLEVQVDSLSHKLDEARQELCTERQHLEAELSTTRTEVRRMEAESESAITAQTVLKAACDKWEAEHHSISVVSVELEAQLEQLGRENAVLQGNYMELHQEKAGLEAHREKLLHEVEELQLELLETCLNLEDTHMEYEAMQTERNALVQEKEELVAQMDCLEEALSLSVSRADGRALVAQEGRDGEAVRQLELSNKGLQEQVERQSGEVDNLRVLNSRLLKRLKTLMQRT